MKRDLCLHSKVLICAEVKVFLSAVWNVHCCKSRTRGQLQRLARDTALHARIARGISWQKLQFLPPLRLPLSAQGLIYAQHLSRQD